MGSVRWSLPLALVAALGGCGKPATPEDRASLLGIWTPTDRSEQIITFHDDGVFDYRYMATLRMHWELGSVGEIKLSSVDGGVRWRCWYTLVDGAAAGGQWQGRDLCVARGEPGNADAAGVSAGVRAGALLLFSFCHGVTAGPRSLGAEGRQRPGFILQSFCS